MHARPTWVVAYDDVVILVPFEAAPTAGKAVTAALQYACDNTGRGIRDWTATRPVSVRLAHHAVPAPDPDDDVDEDSDRLVRVVLRDAHGCLVEDATLPAAQAADKARDFVFYQGADPEEGGPAAALLGLVEFYPAE